MWQWRPVACLATGGLVFLCAATARNELGHGNGSLRLGRCRFFRGCHAAGLFAVVQVRIKIARDQAFAICIVEWQARVPSSLWNMHDSCLEHVGLTHRWEMQTCLLWKQTAVSQGSLLLSSEVSSWRCGGAGLVKQREEIIVNMIRKKSGMQAKNSVCTQAALSK